MKTKELNTKLRAGMFRTIRSEEFAVKDDKTELYPYRWKANSGEVMPGLFGGIQLDIATMKLDRFELNNIILFSHDGKEPVGLGEASKENDVLFMGVAFDEVGSTSKLVKAKVDAGTLKGMSIGVDFSKCKDEDFVWDDAFENVTIKNSELLEASICSVPRDSKALREYSFTATEEKPKDSETQTDTDVEAPAKDTDSDKEPRQDDGASEGDIKKEADSDSDTDGENTNDSDTDNESEYLKAQQESHIQTLIENEELKGIIKEMEEDIAKLNRQVVELSEVMEFTPMENENKLDDLHGLEKTEAAFKQQHKE